MKILHSQSFSTVKSLNLQTRQTSYISSPVTDDYYLKKISILYLDLLHFKIHFWGLPIVAQQKGIRNCVLMDTSQSLASLSGLRIRVGVSCGVNRRYGSDLALLWLWHRLVATASIWPLVWKPPYAVGVALKSKKQKKKKNPFLSLPSKQITIQYSI